MALAYQYAEAIGPAPELPGSMMDVERRADFVDAIDRPFAGENFDNSSEVERSVRASVASISDVSKKHMPDVADEGIRLNIALRLWAGCISAAKMIASETKSGTNTAEVRTKVFASLLDPTARDDLIYEAGVEAAPSFKRLRGQPYSFEGVPKDSAVRRYADG
jgi:hypothetical protein